MAGKTVLGNVDYSLQTQTVEDVTHFSLIVTLTAPTAAQINSLNANPLILLPERLVGKSSRGSARRVFLHRGWIRTQGSGLAGGTSLAFQDTAANVIATLGATSAVFSATSAADFVGVTPTGVTLGVGNYGGIADSRGIRLTSAGTFTGGPYGDIMIGLFGSIVPTGSNTVLSTSPTATLFGKSA